MRMKRPSDMGGTRYHIIERKAPDEEDLDEDRNVQTERRLIVEDNYDIPQSTTGAKYDLAKRGEYIIYLFDDEPQSRNTLRESSSTKDLDDMSLRNEQVTSTRSSTTPMSSDIGRRIDMVDVVNAVHSSAPQKSSFSSKTPCNSTKSDKMPSGGYQLHVRTKGFGAKQQNEDMNKKVRDERTETAVRRIHSSMKEPNNAMLKMMKR